jgi:hypothetical protein
VVTTRSLEVTLQNTALGSLTLQYAETLVTLLEVTESHSEPPCTEQGPAFIIRTAYFAVYRHLDPFPSHTEGVKWGKRRMYRGVRYHLVESRVRERSTQHTSKFSINTVC